MSKMKRVIKKAEVVKEENEVDIEVQIIDYLNGHGLVRREHLINYFVEKYEKQTGYSRATIERAITKLTRKQKIKKVPHEELHKYGIIETNQTASYLISQESSSIKEHIETVFKLLEKGDDIDKKLVLKELESYQDRYFLECKQLDTLVNNLKTKDQELLNTLLRIIYHQITKKDIKPTNEQKLIDQLKIILNNYSVTEKNQKNLRTWAIFLLGYYNDQRVVEQLKKDVQTLEPKYFDDRMGIKNDYWHKYTANLIEQNRAELFDLERELRKQKKEHAAQFIAEVRYQAMILLGIAKSSLTPVLPKGITPELIEVLKNIDTYTKQLKELKNLAK